MEMASYFNGFLMGMVTMFLMLLVGANYRDGE